MKLVKKSLTLKDRLLREYFSQCINDVAIKVSFLNTISHYIFIHYLKE